MAGIIDGGIADKCSGSRPPEHGGTPLEGAEFDPGTKSFTASLHDAHRILPRFFNHRSMLYAIEIVGWRCAMDDLFMLGVMLGFYLLMTCLIELCAWLIRKR